MTQVKFKAIVRSHTTSLGTCGRITNKKLNSLIGKRVTITAETELKGQ